MLTLDHDRPVEVGHIGISSVFDYFRVEVLKGLDEKTRGFLSLTAILPAFSPVIASRLTGYEKSGELLAYLHRNNYFTERYGDEYRFHPLFKEFLVTEAERLFNPETMQEVRLRAGKLLLEAGRTEEGMELLIAAGDWQTVIPAILGAASGLFTQGRTRTLEALVEAVPEKIRNTQPWLPYWLGMCRQLYDTAVSRSYMESAFELFQEQSDSVGTLLAWSGIAWSAIYEWNLAPLGPCIEWFEKYLSDHPSFPSAEIEAVAAATMGASLVLYQPWHPDLRIWVGRSLRLAQSTEDNFLRLLAYHNAMLCYFWLGEYSHLDMLLTKIEPYAKAGESILTLWWFYFKSYLVTYAGPFDESPASIALEGVHICERTGIGVQAVPLLLVQGAMGAIDRGDLEKATSLLKQIEAVLPGAPPLIHAQYHITAGLYYLRVGDISRALLHVDEALRFSREIDYPFFEAVIHLQAAFILMEAGELEAAQEQLAAYRSMPVTTSMILEYSRLVAEAALGLKLGTPDVLAFLQEALALGRKNGFIFPLFSWIPSLMSRLCSAALKAGIEVDQVKHIIRSKGLVPVDPDLDGDAWPWAITVRTLGGLEIRINDEPLTFTGKVQKRPLDLLKLLIVKGGKDVPQDAIEDVLWPEAEGDAANDAFKTTLSRLRKLLKIEGTIEVRGGKLSLNQNTIWVDIQALERIAERVSRLRQERRREGILEEAQELSQCLVALSRGDALKDDDAPWIFPCRDRLRGLSLRTLRRLTGIFVEYGRDDLAAALSKSALDMGFPGEEVYPTAVK